MGRKKEMLKMAQIDCIKEMQGKGMTPTEICNRLELSPKTVRKYLAMEDFSPQAPVRRHGPSKLDAYKPQIERILEEDSQTWYKQRHTARRICVRLQKELGADVEYSLVQRYVKLRRQERQEGRLAFNELEWAPGEGQVDFGEADFKTPTGLLRRYYLVLSLPYSNAGFVQVFDGETAECVCEGLQAIFRHLGGCPFRLVFDNATGVGRRIEKRIRLAELFSRFKAHHGFESTFCNPDAGHEKGNVECKVGYHRRNYFVPVPYIGELQAFNRQQLAEAAQDFDRLHYKKERLIRDLLEEDRAALLALPRTRFAACRYVRVQTDGYGKFCVDFRHHYSSDPDYALQEIVVRIGAFTVAPLNRAGIPISEHPREFGGARTDITDYRTTISQLVKSPGAWRNSKLRGQVGGKLQEEMDRQDPAGLRTTLRTLSTLWYEYGYDTAIAALEEAASLGRMDRASSTVLALRIATLGLEPLVASGPDLGLYDQLLLYPTKEVTCHADAQGA
jgi:transposase